MAKTREIKGRMKAVANIRRITKTMQLIATARFQASQKRAVAAQPYTRKIAELVGEVATTLRAAGEGAAGVTHPLLTPPSPAVNRQLVLIITSNRGLCGGYNASLLRTAVAHLRELRGQTPAPHVDIDVVGKKGLAFLKFTRHEIHAHLAQFTDKPDYAAVDALAEQYMKAFTGGEYDAVKVVYMRFISTARQSPTVLTLLPLQPPEVKDAGAAAAGVAGKAESAADYDFSPDPASLLAELLPVTVKTQLFQCFNEAVVSEQVARMVAMKAATDAAGKMGKQLTRQYNRARQTAITTELSEIISGAAALE